MGVVSDLNRWRGPVSLPAVVYLPAGTMLDSDALRAALGGVSRGALYQWRQRYAMPTPLRRIGNRQLSSTREIAAWLACQGVEVRWL